LFGKVVDGVMRLSAYGRVVQCCCDEIEVHFPHARVETCAIMPNHVHAIIILSGQLRHSISQTDGGDEQFGRPVRGSLPTVVRSFKSAATKRINGLRGTPAGSVWQRGYYEHVIRDERELGQLREYMLQNPLRWSLQAEE